MNAKQGMIAVLLLGLLAAPQAMAQTPLNLAAPKESMPPITPEAPISAQPPPTNLQAIAPSSWVYQQPAACAGGSCCGPIGGNGPINSELYMRSGVSFMLSNTAFANSLKPGFEIMGGGRSLFFNRAGDRAWVVDLGVSYTYNDGKPTNAFTFNTIPVTLRGLTRSGVSLGFGHDWFLFGPGNVGSSGGINLRYGIDGGVRLGTSHLDMNIVNTDNGYLRHQDVYGSAFAGIHVGVEVPLGAWTFLAGVRGEYSYTAMGDLLPGVNADLHDLNALFTIGLRY